MHALGDRGHALGNAQSISTISQAVQMVYLEMLYYATCGFIFGGLLGIAIRVLTSHGGSDD